MYFTLEVGLGTYIWQVAYSTDQGLTFGKWTRYTYSVLINIDFGSECRTGARQRWYKYDKEERAPGKKDT